MDRHLNRQELIEAAQKQTAAFDSHLQTCDECRDAVSLLRAFQVVGRPLLPDAPASWVARAAALAENASIADRIKKVVLRLTFDSWQEPQLVGVRDQSALSDRRIRFEIETIILDFRAERRSRQWTFVAQVSGEDTNVGDVILEAGRQKLRADPSGLFHWTSARPPEVVTIRSGDLTIVTPELSWKRP